MSTTKATHYVIWTWYRGDAPIQKQRIAYRSHNAAFNASQETRHRGETYAYGTVGCGCILSL
jgi:hypothetical protein